MAGYLYMMSDRYRGGIYTGVTAQLAVRVQQHRTGKGSEFVAKYGLSRLVYIEVYEDVGYAIVREKRIKKWRREWKIELVESMNPDWQDLFDTIHE